MIFLFKIRGCSKNSYSATCSALGWNIKLFKWIIYILFFVSLYFLLYINPIYAGIYFKTNLIGIIFVSSYSLIIQYETRKKYIYISELKQILSIIILYFNSI